MFGHTTPWIVGRSVTVYPNYPDLTYSVTGQVKRYSERHHTIRLKQCQETTNTTTFDLTTTTFRVNDMLYLDLEVKWDSGWIAGRVVRPHPHNNTVLIDYTDGDQIWTNLSEETYRMTGTPSVKYQPEDGFRLVLPETAGSQPQLEVLVEQLGSLLGHPSYLEIQQALEANGGKLQEAMDQLKIARQTKGTEAQLWIQNQPSSLVNYQVSVRWRAGQWYQGYISCYDVTSGLFYVHYTDGDEEWVDLTQYPVVLLGQVPMAATAPPPHHTLTDQGV